MGFRCGVAAHLNVMRLGWLAAASVSVTCAAAAITTRAASATCAFAISGSSSAADPLRPRDDALDAQARRLACGGAWDRPSVVVVRMAESHPV